MNHFKISDLQHKWICSKITFSIYKEVRQVNKGEVQVNRLHSRQLLHYPKISISATNCVYNSRSATKTTFSMKIGLEPTTKEILRAK